MGSRYYIYSDEKRIPLFIIIDWYSRRIIDHELSTTLEKEFVLTCLKRAFAKRKPEIINGDQEGHFTNPEYVNLLEVMGIKIFMDGKGQALDNVRTKRFFRTLKYDLIYINKFESPQELRRSLDPYMNKYSTYRPHFSIDGHCPDEAYYEDIWVAA